MIHRIKNQKRNIRNVTFSQSDTPLPTSTSYPCQSQNVKSLWSLPKFSKKHWKIWRFNLKYKEKIRLELKKNRIEFTKKYQRQYRKFINIFEKMFRIKNFFLKNKTKSWKIMKLEWKKLIKICSNCCNFDEIHEKIRKFFPHLKKPLLLYMS